MTRRVLRTRDWVGMAAILVLCPLSGLAAGLWLLGVVFR